jgi:hypothetical protein
MKANDHSDEICMMWQNQIAAPFRMTPEQMRDRVTKLNAKLRRGSWFAYAICIVEIVAFTWFFVIFPNPLQRIGSALTIAAMLYLMVQVRRHRVSTAAAAAAIVVKPSAEYYRAALERQRDFHQGGRFWARVFALLPGPLLFLIGAGQAETSDAGGLGMVAAMLVFVGVMAAVVNRRLARRYQARIDDVNSFEQEQS